MEEIIEKLKRQMENLRTNDYACCTLCWSWKEADAILTALEENKRMRELVEWLNQECPEGTDETFDLTHDFTQKLRVRIERITQPKKG